METKVQTSAPGIPAFTVATIVVLALIGSWVSSQKPVIRLCDNLAYPFTNRQSGTNTLLIIGATNPPFLKITGSDATNLVLWSRTQPVVTKTHEGWTVRFGK